MISHSNVARIDDSVIASSFAIDNDPSVLARIYDNELNLAVWSRQLSADIVSAAEKFVSQNQNFKLSKVVSPNKAKASLQEELKASESLDPLLDDVRQLVEMFSCLFDLDFIGLRLNVLETAMCPRFHVDHVPCRLITTYLGDGTEWLENSSRNRSLVEVRSPSQTDERFSELKLINKISAGGVALVKGENWEGNEGAGLIHRSPKVIDSGRRLILSLDFHG